MKREQQVASGARHPYWPRDLSIPSYVENDRSMAEILTFLFSVSGLMLLAAWFFTGRAVPGPRGGRKLSGARRLALCWFSVCGFIHLVVEGWFIFYHGTIPSDQSLLSQLWKEYSKGDSRYVISDNFTVCVETITVLCWGPLSIWAVLAFLYNRPNRFLLQLVISLGQLYGAVLYFFTEHRDGYIHSQPGHPIYFWFYFFFLNLLWVIIPAFLILDAWGQLSAAQVLYDSRLVEKDRSKRQ
ncbi:3-beta-hydroxysteroid-Delta(8),Delta(7)-isomerase [Scleropages formosus]|uniref:EBP cholestenol delta-isomerase n=1 Tax=Scleropages formosus TaxID=113540 RepID=A0A8C9RJU0_SCLFO|nr:3-beta-hydroxysteroid-Delta(8),Delta(7)-isomerase [Scleropages formosus]